MISRHPDHGEHDRVRTSSPGQDSPQAFHLLAKPTGAICNLDCSYCFFLSKEMLYPGSRFRMADELLETYIRQLIEAHRSASVVEIAWQGGEPTLMGLDFFRRSVQLVDRHLAPGQRPEYTIQTNGTKLDAEWAAFFKENGFLVGISIDGPREIHDTFRVTRGGRGSFDQVMRGLEQLCAAEVDYNMLTTVHAANERHGREVYLFARDQCGARFMQFIPVVERMSGAPDEGGANWASWRDRPLYLQAGEDVSSRSVSQEGYGRFLIDVFEEWVRHDVGEVYVQMFDTALANWVGEQPGMCVHCETCGLSLALEHTGDVYSCDHFVEPRYLLGNIRDRHLSELVGSEQQREFGLDKAKSLPRYCRECDVRFSCHGGCPKDRFTRTPEGEPGLNYLCPSFKLFFQHVDAPMRAMAELLAERRPPSTIVEQYRRRDASRGRNEACTCGSGRKWKHCHGDPASVVTASRADSRLAETRSNQPDSQRRRSHA
jgi:uncharacterized protein